MQFPIRGEKYLKIEELQTFIFVVILGFTTWYGTVAVDSRYASICEKEREKYKTGPPPEKVEGVIMLLANNNDVQTLSTNWKTWMHSIRASMNKTEFYIVTPGNINWRSIGPIFNTTDCAQDDKLCLFKKGLEGAVYAFPNFKWLISATPSVFINENGLNQYLSELHGSPSRKRLLNAGVTQIGKQMCLHRNSAWFMNRRTAQDWIARMSAFEELVHSNNDNFELATGHFLPSLSLTVKEVADPRFIPHQKDFDEFADLVDVADIEKCNASFRYFDIIEKPVVRIRDAVSWYFTLPAEERNVVMSRIPKLSNLFGYTMTRTKVSFCVLPKQ